MADKPGVVIYFDILPALEKMERTEAGELFIAALRYAQYGQSPALDGAADLVWSFIKSGIDRDSRRYEKKQLQSKWKVYCREEKKAGRDPLSFDEWMEEHGLPDDINCYQVIAGDNKSYPTKPTTSQTHPNSLTTPTPTPIPAPAEMDTPCAAEQSAPHREKPHRKRAQKNSYGQYGWVKLSDEEYDRLLADLGEAEVERCIQYIDESAQSSGNKNKWKDWNLVIRRCNREGWGRRYQRQRSTGGSSPMDDLRLLHQMYEEEGE